MATRARLQTFNTRPPASQQVTGLITGSNVSPRVGFIFTGAALNPMYPATYIFRYRPVQQTGFYTTFFWGDDNPDFVGGGDYYGCHPFPTPGEGSAGTAHYWEISINGQDKIDDDNGHSTLVIKDVWYTQAVTARLVSGDLEIKFYWDLPDLTKVITYVLPSGNIAVPDFPSLMWLSNPWAPTEELNSGTLRAIQVYSTNHSTANILSAAACQHDSEVLALGLSNPWYINMNPTPGDISDKSGQGHHPAWVNANRPTLYEG